MFENLNYAELDKMRDALLVEASGLTDRDEGKLQVIGELSLEMERREAEAHRRILSATFAINVLVLAVIIFTAGCQTVKEGLYGTGRLAGAAGQDAKWIAEKLADNIQVQEGK